MMKTKRKDIPKFVTGGELALISKASEMAPSFAQTASGVMQFLYGRNQRREAVKALRELQRNQPTLEIPPALRRLANEPIAEEFMEAQEMGAQRRTAQAIDVLGRGGSRTLVGGLPRVTESERIGEQQRFGQYEQERKNAEGNLARSQDALQRLRLQEYINDLNAARQARDAADQNIYGGINTALEGVSVGAKKGLSDINTGQNEMTYGNTLLRQEPIQQLDNRGFASFKDGGPIKTKGKFSHRKNPKYLVDGSSGEVEAELTGDETVFNKDDSEQMEKLANNGEDKKLRKFIKGKFKKFKTKRK